MNQAAVSACNYGWDILNIEGVGTGIDSGLARARQCKLLLTDRLLR